jgi:hypothetical protein
VICPTAQVEFEEQEEYGSNGRPQPLCAFSLLLYVLTAAHLAHGSASCGHLSSSPTCPLSERKCGNRPNCSGISVLTQTRSEHYRGAFLKSFVGVGAIAIFGV